MDESRAWELFGAVRSATLGTIDPSGAPRLVPVVFAVLDDRRLLTAVDHKPKSTRRLARLTDLERDPRVTLLADQYDDDWSRLWWVRITGAATITHHPPPGADVLVERYEQYRLRPPEGPWITVTPVRITGWETGG